MSAGAIKQLVATQFLPASVGTLYTAPQALGNSIALPESIVVANVTGSAATFTLYSVPSGGSAATSNAVFYQVSVPANTTWVGRYPGGAWVMPGGSTLQGLASSASAVTITVGGQEFI